MPELKESKPAVKSIGVVGSAGGVFGSLLLVAHILGYPIPEGVTELVIAAATAVSSAFGLFGRVKAKETIDGIFFKK